MAHEAYWPPTNAMASPHRPHRSVALISSRGGGGRYSYAADDARPPHGDDRSHTARADPGFEQISKAERSRRKRRGASGAELRSGWHSIARALNARRMSAAEEAAVTPSAARASEMVRAGSPMSSSVRAEQQGWALHRCRRHAVGQRLCSGECSESTAHATRIIAPLIDARIRLRRGARRAERRRAVPRGRGLVADACDGAAARATARRAARASAGLRPAQGARMHFGAA